MKITFLDRLLLLATSLLAAWQVAVGIDGSDALPMAAYTVGFGILLLAGLLLMILGWEALESPAVVVLSTLIPLSLSLGLVWERMPSWRAPYLAFAVLGFLAVVLTRLLPIRNRLPLLVLILVHGIAGLTIFLLPIIWALAGRAGPGFALVGAGGALIGAGGLLLSSLRAGRPVLPRQVILKALPALLLLTTAAFVAGFTFA
jgi:hypothetical protein